MASANTRVQNERSGYRNYVESGPYQQTNDTKASRSRIVTGRNGGGLVGDRTAELGPRRHAWWTTIHGRANRLGVSADDGAAPDQDR